MAVQLTSLICKEDEEPLQHTLLNPTTNKGLLPIPSNCSPPINYKPSKRSDEAKEMSSSIPTQLAETIQATHINRHPDPAHDINPATAASAKKPVYTSIEKVSHGEDDDETVVVRAWPVQRTQKFPPIPDMRFEQSYLHSIEKAEGWGDVLYITVKDQVCCCSLVPSSFLRSQWARVSILFACWKRGKQARG